VDWACDKRRATRSGEPVICLLLRRDCIVIAPGEAMMVICVVVCVNWDLNGGVLAIVVYIIC